MSEDYIKNKEQLDFSKEIIYLIRRLMQAGEHYSKELIKNYNVSAPQLACLITIYENGTLSPSQIARNILVNSSTVTGIIDRLEQKGLVSRVRNSPDRRVIKVILTDAGSRLAQNAPSPIQQKIIDGLGKLPPDELNIIIKSMYKLIEMLDVEDLQIEDMSEESLI